MNNRLINNGYMTGDEMVIKKTIVKTALELAEKLESEAIIVSGNIKLEDLTTNIPVYFAPRRPKSIIDYLVSTSSEKQERGKEIADKITQEVEGNTKNVENVAAIEHLLGDLKRGVVVGIVETKDSSSIIVHDLSESPLIKAMRECEERVSPEVMRAVLTIAFDIAATGREGSQVGTAFIIGDVDEVMSRSHQMILNPYAGHSKSNRNILNKQNWESIKEFAQLDGVFVVSEDGVIEAAGKYLDVDAKDLVINKGLGGRHVSAAAITRDTVAIAVTVSESGGVVRVYKDGKETLCIESTKRAFKQMLPE